MPSKPTIFRVNDDLRSVNQKLYDPKVVAIGPLHHEKDYLQKMEQHKLRYLKLMLNRRKESSVDKYVIAMRSLEERARRCYAEPIHFSQDDFVQMLLLDSCFTIELIRKYWLDEWRESNDPIFKYEQVLSQLRHDLMLVENQVPFFVLDRLFSMTRSGNPDDNIRHLIQLFIDDISPWPGTSEMAGRVSTTNVDHLLCLVHKIWCSSFDKMVADRPVKTEEEKMLAINPTTELQEAGIKFEKDTENNFLDIKFTAGVMKIPGLDVSDDTEAVLRNIIAFEHYLSDDQPKYVSDYAFFLHCLINSSKDVERLRRYGILTNFLGDDAIVSNMFNRLGKNIIRSSSFSYADVLEDVNRHCGRRRNRWMANLRHNHFNSPWAFISVFAAAMLLLFTLTQTVFSVLSYTKSR